MMGIFFFGLILFSGITDVSQRSAEVRLVAGDTRRLVLEFIAGEFNLVDSRGGVRLEMAGMGSLSQPGEPYLPGMTVLAGVAQDGVVRLSYSVGEEEYFDNLWVEPADGLTPYPVVPGPVYQEDRFWPGAFAEVERVELVRGVRVAWIRISPVQFNPVQRRLRLAKRLRIELNFSQQAEPRSNPDALDSVLARILVNPEALNWKVAVQDAETANFFSRFGVWYKIRTETTGVYQIKAKELADAGVSLSTIDPRTLRLFSLGRYRVNGPYPDTMVEMPIQVVGEEDGRFDRNDYIIFYAQAPSYWNDSLTRWEENYYTRHRVFWLTWGAGAGRRMEFLPGEGAVAPLSRAQMRYRIEEDLQCPARGGLLWVWERFNSSFNNVRFYLPFTLLNRDSLKRLVVRFYGKSDKPVDYYPAVLRLNGVVLDTVSIRAARENVQPSTFVFESIPILAGAGERKVDTLEVELINPADVYVDYIEVDCVDRLELTNGQPGLSFYFYGPQEFKVKGADRSTLVLDVTDPWMPRMVTGFELTGDELKFRISGSGLRRIYCVRAMGFKRVVSIEARHPGWLRSAGERADYYVVCADDLLPAARLFARYREGNVPGIENARASAVGLSSIYDDYAFGMEEPGAIKAFFSAKRPAYGLLLGDATYDYKDNLRMGKKPVVPAYEVGFDLDYEVYNQFVKAVDAWYADFDGEGTSPDMILARMTARTVYEVRRFLDKVRGYEGQIPGLWARRLLLLGDDEYLGDPDDPRKRESFVHIRGCEQMLPFGRDLLDVSKVYLTEYPWDGNTKPRANAELLRQLNKGALLWIFFGHGAGFQLCHERAFHVDDVPSLRNQLRLPVAFFGSCGVGRFDDTRYEAIAEELVRVSEGGIATIGASKATFSSSNEQFARTFLGKIVEFTEQPVGASFYTAWLTPGNYLYILFGDPALRLQLPVSDSQIVVNPDTFYPGGVVNWQINPSPAQGYFSLRVTEAERLRLYRSFESITYSLAGEEFFKITGRYSNRPVTGSFVVPRMVYPDTVVVGNGWYVRDRNTCRITGLVVDRDRVYSVVSPPIYLDTTSVLSVDTRPPEITVFADQRQLKVGDTNWVPKRFTMHGILSDPSGVLLVTHPDYGLSFYLGNPVRRVELKDHFDYDANSTAKGSFFFPVEMELESDSLVIFAADNYLNRRVAVYYLKTDLRGGLRIDSCLVYPNPVENRAYFTFWLSQSALVTVKIFTITGRLIEVLGPVSCGFGYNQIEWDGLDRYGNQLANGVYLYKIEAQSIEGGQNRTASFRDRFIVRN